LGLTAWDAATGRQVLERRDYYTVVCNAAGWRADGVGIAVVRLPDRSYFVSAFTDPGEVRPNPPPDRGPSPPRARAVALSPDAPQPAATGAQLARVHAEPLGRRPLRRGRPAPRPAALPPRRHDPVLGPGSREGAAEDLVPAGRLRDRARLHPGRPDTHHLAR